jgi:hypothetical protein
MINFFNVDQQGVGKDGRLRRDPQLCPVSGTRSMQNLSPLLPPRKHHDRPDLAVRNEVQPALPP